MKKLLLSILCLFLTQRALALDLDQFNQVNFKPSGGMTCGLHLEVAGDSLVLSYIIPPEASGDFSQVCGSDGVYRNCNAQSWMVEFKCNAHTCVGIQNARTITLLNDGNIFFSDGYKFFRTNESQFRWCKR